MEWLQNIFGSSDGNHRRYGEDEYYEYPRNSGSSSWHGPSIFEDPYTNRYSNQDSSNSYQNSRNSYLQDSRSPYLQDSRSPYLQDHRYSDRDSSLHSSQYDAGTSNNSRSPYQQDNRYSHRDSSLYSSQYDAETSNNTGRHSTGKSVHVSYEEESDDEHRNGEIAEADSDGAEDLAYAMQETLSLQYPAPFGTTTIAPSFSSIIAPTPRSAGLSTCAGCHSALGFGRFLTCLGQNWHPGCFCCRSCKKSIVDREFSVQGHEPYHRNCYKELFHPKCEICHNFIPPNSQGLIEYRSHPFWNQKYCPAHEKDGRKRCCSCDRIEPVDDCFTSLEDGRKSCSECMETAVMHTKGCQPLYREILKFYRTLGMSVDQEIPMLLVERAALNYAREVEKDGHTHAPETRGLCLSEEQTITTVFENKPEARGGYPASYGTETKKLTRHCEVTAILVLYGLPRLLTGSILAHELMHAWLRLDGRFPNLDNEIEEGICQVIAHIWLKAEIEKLSRNSRTGASQSALKRLGEFFLHQIETDSSPIYGDGFRSAFAAVSTFGLRRTLERLRHTGRLPK